MWWFVNAVAGVVLALAPLLTAGKSCEPVQEEVTQQRRFEALVEDMNLPCNKLGIGLVFQQHIQDLVLDLFFVFVFLIHGCTFWLIRDCLHCLSGTLKMTLAIECAD